MPTSTTGISIRIRRETGDLAKGSTSSRPRRRFVGSPAQAGFTLIEVVLTVSLLAIVLALVLPRIGTTPSLSESSRHLVGAIHSLYTAAASSNRTYRLHIDLDKHIYWATVFTGDGDRLPTDPSLAWRTALSSP
ncbi:MAG: prepilin-type N-terminal cleavage/methylation domain-containing protein, partial [Nitrospirota bacterium]|nr:prepilin-type N-terminal cleavage/methylation domain-containing protein [Nitrospirota bacterium]